MSPEIRCIDIDYPDGSNIIIGQTHFMKTIEDLYEIVASTVPQARFGVAFTEASGPCLIRTEGNDRELVAASVGVLQSIGAGHLFCILLRDAYPINILNQVKGCQEVCGIYCATANRLQFIVAATGQGTAVLGVVDGLPPRGVENDGERRERRELLRNIGYKL